MLPLIWRETALDDLDQIVGYIAQFDPAAAQSLHEHIVSIVEMLCGHPYMYRAGRVPGTRELVAHTNYIVVYRVLADVVEITNVMHARQQYP